MEQQNLLKKKSPLSDKYRAFYIRLIDGIIVGIISLIIWGSISYVVLMGLFKVPPLYSFLAVFFMAVLCSPYLGRIRFGEKLMIKYEKFLDKLVK